MLKKVKNLVNLILSKPQLLLITAILIPIILITSIFYYQYKKMESELKIAKTNSDKLSDLSKTETQSLVEKIGKLMVLPTNEVPTIATVTDLSKLKDQPFFDNAQNGDKVVIYTSNKKAILYRPSANKIIDVSPINIDTPITTSSDQKQTGSPTITLIPTLVPVKANITILNGTETAGLASKMEKSLKKVYPDITVVTKDFAQRRNYIKTLVIDTSGAKKTEADTLAAYVKGESSVMPKNETIPTPEAGSPKADILIIIGQEYKPQ